ncbi:FecR family protein [Dysgonomonas termitidis]|uniref:FecR family protein n=1 Tax=Dysgonomonas termitidis TaxID=1516126 RepID=A0ABV9KS54_9BACT
MMKKNIFKDLLRSYLNGTYSNEDKVKLADMIRFFTDNQLRKILWNVWNEYEPTEQLSDKRSKEILSSILTSEPKVSTIILPKRKRLWFRIASAAVLLIILAGLGNYILNRDTPPQENTIVLKVMHTPMDEPVSYVRNIMLPDGSQIVLQANSTVELAPGFGAERREIRLVGEAFFDIKYNAGKPFIIYSGELKTTVLGTSFNIKAWPDDDRIRVTVTRGKVRVENTKQVLANLSLNEEIEYDKTKLAGKKFIVDEQGTKDAVDWTKQEMEFNGMSIKDIAVVLSKRYNVDIEIRGSKLTNTLIVASFRGTESLESILDILCVINSATNYVIEDNKVTIYQIEQ